MRNLRWTACVWLIGTLTASAQPTPERPDQKRLAEIFAPSGTPSIKAKAWVKIDIGPANWNTTFNGWILDDGDKEVVLMDWHGEIRKLKKPGPKQSRPKVKEQKDGSMLWSDLQQADRSIAWKIEPDKYIAKSKKFLADGLPDDKEPKAMFGHVWQRFGLADHVVDAARFAYYADQLGEKAHAADLVAHAVKAQKKYVERYAWMEKPGPLHVFVAQRIASARFNGAVGSAHYGLERKELQKQWERLAALPHHEHREKAKEMAKHYENLLAEDAKWVEPDAKALAKMADEKKAEYWLYHLRDLDVGQISNPGSCYVLADVNRGRGGDQRPNAAVELEKLGKAAVPSLKAHLNDARPTRCKGHWRSYWPEGHYLLTYGNCCKQILEAIEKK